MPAHDGERDPQDGVPWGRRPVAGIPVPPFADPGQHETFLLALAEHVALTSGAAGPVSPAAFALVAALSDAWPRNGGPAELQPWVLRLAVATYFPAPWTPQGLVAAIVATGLTPGRDWYAGPDEVGHSGDPEWSATREATGRWVARFRERGVERLDAELDGDDDVALHLMSRLRGNPYPFGWGAADQGRLEALSAIAGPTAAAWRRHAGLPYLASWSDGRNDG